MRWKDTDGSASTKILTLILVGSLMLGPGVTALASGNEPEEEISVSEIDERLELERSLETVVAPSETEIESQSKVAGTNDEGEGENIEEPTGEDDNWTFSEETIEDEIELIESTESHFLDGLDEEIVEKIDDELVVECDESSDDELIDFLTKDEHLDLFFERCLADVAPELHELSVDQREYLSSLWRRNNFSYDPTEDMLSEYKIPLYEDDGIIFTLSDEAAMVVMLYNFRACLNYVVANYTGDPWYMVGFEGAIEQNYEALRSIDVSNLYISAITIGSNFYDMARNIESAEIDKYGASDIVERFNTYPSAAGDSDASSFFNLVDEMYYSINN